MLDDDVPTFDVAALGLSVPEMLNRVRQVSNILSDVMQRASLPLEDRTSVPIRDAAGEGRLGADRLTIECARRIKACPS
jgi:hypothetical protein